LFRPHSGNRVSSSRFHIPLGKLEMVQSSVNGSLHVDEEKERIEEIA
jgi:hypothetical protein